MAELDYFNNIVFTRIKNNFSETLKKKYPDLFFTTSDKLQSAPRFPTVYVYIQGAERGQDLDGRTINFGYYTITVDVTDNQNNNRADEVLNEVKRIMKTMRADVREMPHISNTADTYRSVARFTLFVGNGDVL